ncbi:unnamed protein product [Darwinula stevensoni]|uniref:Bromodomain associated domain-containing protein n=1 Tax=Darwinula stevensoni TaxID=69355 RepID=A0A7R8XFL1_9CRUS|nr:unnamed protein product [Darwinula stevensoni]CAG0890789.1 unnamed protein product [Darwinula stevensoni]
MMSHPPPFPLNEQVFRHSIKEVPEDLLRPDPIPTQPPEFTLAEDQDARQPAYQVFPSCAMDTLVLDTIKQQQFINEMERRLSMKASAQAGTKYTQESPIGGPPSPVNNPFLRVLPSDNILPSSFQGMMEAEEKGKCWKPPPELTPAVARQILRKSVATIMAHLGYEESPESILDLMTDVAHDYLSKFTRLLRLSTDRELMSLSAGFPEPLERVMYEMGMGSMKNLQMFYIDRVVKYHRNCINKAKDLWNQYMDLTGAPPPKTSLTIDTNTSIAGTEEEFPEIQFPEVPSGLLSDVPFGEGSLQMETGLQVLQNLEQGNISLHENPKNEDRFECAATSILTQEEPGILEHSIPEGNMGEPGIPT